MKKPECLALTFLTFFLFSTPLFAKEFLALSNLIHQAAPVTVEHYPNSDDVLIDDFTQVEYQPDGTSETWTDTAIKILTEKGKRDNRTLSLRFNTSYGTNYFSKVEIIKPNGISAEIDIESQSKVMVDPSQMSANIYNPNSKVMQLSIPGLEIGDTLHFITHQIDSKTVVPDTWSGYQVFEHTSPIEHSTYQVIAPKERPLVKIALKAEIPGTVTYKELKSEENDKIIHTWEINDVPRIFEEPNMPASYTVAQRLLVSTMENWEDLSKWYWKLCKPRLEAITPELEAKAKELVANSTNTTEKINAIFNFVSQDIRYMGITTEEEAPGYEPHDVSVTFSNRYGVCRDKAALLVSMLRIVDIEAFPVIIMAGPKKDEEVPQAFFNHAVTAALDENGEYILMDSTDENTKDIFPSYLQNMSYIVARPEGESLRTSPIIPAEENLLKITSIGSLDSSGNLKAESDLIFEGINDTVYRGYFSKIKPEERRRFFEGHVKKSIPTAELESFTILPKELRDTTQPLTVHLTYSADNLLIEGTNNKMLNLPKLGSTLGYANFLLGQTGLEERKYPLFTRMTAGVHETLQLNVPDDIGTINMPKYEQIGSEQITFKMALSQAAGMLNSTNIFLLNTVEFTPDEYRVLKQDLKDIEYNLRKKLILDRPTPRNNIESDVRILEQETTLVLEDSSHWKETSRSRIEILTYAGKKNNSEIKLTYNPAWQTIELTRAVVTHPDGTTKEISPEEVNLMDANWVASAPRYPTEKILVANLPGVEIGSVLEYEYVSTVSGKPFFSTTCTFNAHDPIDLKTLTLKAPESLDLNILNTGIEETTSSSNGTISYIWKAENQSSVKQEESLPSWWAFNPAVFISTSDWKSYGEQVHRHLITAASGQSASEELADKLTSNISIASEKVVALRDWVAKNIRQAGPGFTSLPLSAITPADQTLDECYGNNADRMVVLYSLLKAAGLDPEFVLSGDLSLIPDIAEPLLTIPSRTAFGTILIKVNLDGKPIYLNGSSQYAKLGTSGYDHRAMLNLNNGTLETIDVASDMDNQSHAVIEMNITADGTAELTQTAVMQGTEFTSFHQNYSEITPEKRRRHFLEIISGVSQSAKAASELITDYSTYPGKLEFSVVADRYAVQDGDYLYFVVPGGLGGLLKYRSNERTLPLAWNGYIDAIQEYNIVLPDGYEPAILPEKFSWQAPNGAGLIEIGVTYSERSNTIQMVQIADLKPALIPAEDFPSIIEASQKLAHPDMRTILLKKKQP